MPLHDKAFWIVSFFLIGVVFASTMQSIRQAGIFGVLAVALLALLLFIVEKKTLALLSLVAILGIWYAQWFTAHYEEKFTAPMGEKITIVGLVEKVAVSGESQRVDLSLHKIPPPAGTPFYKGRIRATLSLFPGVRYGDVLTFDGVLKPIDEKSSGYFQKEGIRATVSFPKQVEVIARNQGLPIKAALFTIRDYVQSSFERVLTPSQATLMTGLVLGKSGGFDKEFTEKMKVTGTTHLVALSGYNIAVIIDSLYWLLGFALLRKRAVLVCIAAVIGFVIMTGAEASVVRAAIMATIMVIAERSGRLYSMRNAIAVTALVMVLLNPNILVFDVGFQLSFLALLGIVYIRPALQKFFKMKSEPGFLAWRKNLVTTVAAQLAVLPILLSSFGFFSPLSIVTNVLLLTFIPYTMGLGFFIALASVFSSYLAFVVALPARILLGYELGVIDLFARISGGFTIENLPIFVSIFYYAALIGFILYTKQRYVVGSISEK